MALLTSLPTAYSLSDVLPMISSSLPLAGVLFLLYYASLQLACYLNPLRKLPYPPGPPRNFILGNARDLLSNPLWLRLTDLSAIYGPITHLKALDKHFIVLNSLDDAVELLDKRSNNYSDRLFIPMLDLGGANFITPLKPYGPSWHEHRRRFQQMFRSSASLEYRPTQVEKVNDLLYSLLDTPQDFATHIKTLSVSIIMYTMYGYKVLPQNDPFQKLAEEAVTTLVELVIPGASIVNVLPFLRFLPSWFPGAHFHHVARVVRKSVKKMQDVPYEYMQDNMTRGTATSSLVANLLETCKSEDDHQMLKDIAATGYAAGADTTTSTLVTFIHAMAKLPKVQKKAQEELDRVIGTDRLPNYDDQSSLPYIQAICREVLRWRPAFPLSIFHASITEDVYKGYHIPAGTAIIPNIWAMTQDPVKYKNPEEFNPDRFLTKNNELNDDDMTYPFGFGRRICPGRHMADATVWLMVATFLTTFDIRAPKDASGNDIPLDVKYSDAMISHALPFKCMITPRSSHKKQLIVDIRNNAA